MSYPSQESGPKLRLRAESFADHYSQARQFYVSQTPVEQTHIKDAFVFELSKIETPAIRARVAMEEVGTGCVRCGRGAARGCRCRNGILQT